MTMQEAKEKQRLAMQHTLHAIQNISQSSDYYDDATKLKAIKDCTMWLDKEMDKIFDSVSKEL